MRTETEDPRLRVLIVDDDAPLRTLLQEWLEADGRFVVAGQASDGHEVVARFAEHPEPALLIDLDMPTMDGLAASAAIRRLNPDVRIVLLTGSSLDALFGWELRTVVDAVLYKGSVTPGELASVLLGATERGRVRSIDRRPESLRVI